MKNFIKLLIISFIICGIQISANAIQTRNVNEEKAINKNLQSEVTKEDTNNVTEQSKEDKMFSDLKNRYINDFRTCEPLHFTQDIDLFGLKVGLKFDINGWEKDKCSYYFSGNVGSFGKDVKEVFDFDIPDESISKIKPEIQCYFTKKQLNILVDAFLSSQKSPIENILNGQTEKDISNKEPSLTPEEKRGFGIRIFRTLRLFIINLNTIFRLKLT